MKKFFKKLYLVLIFIFLYAPIGTLVVLSFNESKSRAKWGGFSFKWYQKLFESEQIMQALYTTLIIAFLSALIATIIGTIAAIGINSMRKTPKSIVLGLNNIPLLNADIVTGISLMLCFLAFGISLGFKTVLIAHITFNIPYVILSVMPKLRQTQNGVYEAALDLGATPVYAFFKVIFPDILPGVLSGFLLAFTMSLDDFIITHFTKGVGINTLSTLIYSEVRRGVKPTMYALSTLLFFTVLVLLLIINKPENIEKAAAKKAARAARRAKAAEKAPNWFQKRKWLFAPALILVVFCLILFSGRNKESNVVRVYNWGDYIDEEVISMFEEETGIKVVYDLFETNEEMYPVIEAGGTAYDVICPSDYMIAKMIENNLLQEINFDNIPNIKYIDEQQMKSSRFFDPENKYSIPYTYGTLGILYNKNLVDDPVDSWNILWDEKYAGNVLMYSSIRDLFVPALALNGSSINTTNEEELARAKELLIAQKPMVQGYIMDQIKDKMINGEAALAMAYSGEYLTIQESNEDIEFVVPKEGSNCFIDSWVIPANAENKENAEAWLNFLCRPDIAKMNFEYITYSTPNTGAVELIDEDLKSLPAVFPSKETLERCEVFQYLGEDADTLYNNLWKEIKGK